jgi:hypothetical protein
MCTRECAHVFRIAYVYPYSRLICSDMLRYVHPCLQHLKSMLLSSISLKMFRITGNVYETLKYTLEWSFVVNDIW